MKRTCGAAARVVTVAVLVLLGLTAAGHAAVRGEVVGPGLTRVPVAVPELKWLGGSTHAEAARSFVRTLASDLELSGLFRVIDPAAYIEDSQQAGITRDSIDFDDWDLVGAHGLVRAGYYGSADGLLVEARYFDVAARSSRGGRRLEGEPEDATRMGHRMADAVIEFVTGRPGPFDTRIAFVSDRDAHFREIYLYSFDGRVQRVTDHASVVMAPAWHPEGHTLSFTSFRSRRPVLYALDLDTSVERALTSRLGVNVGAAWSPDGKRLLLAREQGGNTDIHELEPTTGRSRRLSTHWGIDVDPTWAPDGRRFAFCSSRAGNPQIYVMNAAGGDLQRLTFEGKYNCSPAWSPDGRTIAYAGRRQGSFQLFTISAEGGLARQLTFVGSNEDPTWSPDSRYLAFASRREGRRSAIRIIDAYGRWERQLTDGEGDDTSPSWSRRRQAGREVRR